MKKVYEIQPLIEDEQQAFHELYQKYLPEGYRQAVILHDIHGLQHKEIAEARGKSVGTSKSQLHKGRAMLRKLITGPSQQLNSQSVASIV